MLCLLRRYINLLVVRLERLIKDPGEGNAWHADHIVAVADGGGEPFSLNNPMLYPIVVWSLFVYELLQGLLLSCVHFSNFSV